MSNPGGAPGVLGALPLGNGNQSPSSDAGLPPPSDGQVPSSPTDGQVPSSSDSPPSPDGSSSLPPPDGSNSDSSPPQSPPSDTGSSSTTPPPDPNSNSSPPLSSDSPPPPLSSDSSPPPPDSNSSVSAPPLESQTSPPPPESNPNSSPPPPEGGSNTQPPPQEGGSNSQPPPPDGTLLPSPPPPSNNPPDSPPAESVPPPDASTDSPPAPAELSPPLPDNQQPPATGNPPPQSHDTPPVPTSYNPPPSPSSHTPERVPELSSPSSRSSHSPSTPSTSSSTNSSNSNGNSSVRTVAGVTVAGVLIIALIGIFFVIARKRKRRSQSHYDPYGPPPPNFSGNTDGYYYGQPQSQQHALQHTPQHSQQHSIGISGNSQEYYNGKPMTGPSSGMNSYGSYKGPDSGTLMSSQSCFTYEELMGITEGFSRQNIIGEGGFGAVYKGSLPDGKVVAVKQLKAGSGQGEREFRAEVEIISRVHHRHLVSLVGYCIAENQRLLVYEFVPNNTLEYHLHGKGVPVMEWPKRLKIAVGAARGLAYLHEDCHPRIIHRDIKSANILIDDVFEAQVADFGLAKLSNDISTHVSTRVMGTFGYMAPEYASSGKLTDRSDVFSFGVVLLELVTGRKPVDQDQPMGDESLVEWARPVLQNARETGDYSELADPRLGKRYVEQELIRMAETAAACVRHSAPKRPRMVQVLRALDTDGDMPDISNGVKVGQSTIFECGPNSDLQKFRMMAFGSDDSGEYNTYSGTLNSREMLPKPPGSWRAGDSAEFTSGESETRAINPRRGY